MSRVEWHKSINSIFILSKSSENTYSLLQLHGEIDFESPFRFNVVRISLGNQMGRLTLIKFIFRLIGGKIKS